MKHEFKAFDKVLVSASEESIWHAELYSHYDNSYGDRPHRTCGGYSYNFCVPYEGNEHLIGKRTIEKKSIEDVLRDSGYLDKQDKYGLEVGDRVDEDTVKSYVERQSECGIQVGDTVKITRKAESCEDGWDDCWSGRMDKFIGETGTVKKIDNEHGIKLEIDGETWLFPYFVLEKVEAGLQIQDVFKPQIGDVCFVWNENVQFKTIKVCSGFKNNGEPLFSFWNIEDAIPYDHYELYTGQKPEWIDK